MPFASVLISLIIFFLTNLNLVLKSSGLKNKKIPFKQLLTEGRRIIPPTCNASFFLGLESASLVH